MRIILALAAPACLLASCAQNTPPKLKVQTPDQIADEKYRCNALEPGYRDIVPSQKIVRPGNAITFQVGAQTGTFGFKPFPADCLSGWKAEPSEYGSYDAATGKLTIAADAPSGAQITISVVFFGETVSRVLKITGRNEVVLTGTRSQKEGPDCPGAEQVGEIDFKDNGRFGVTYQPFESYVDYWGTYSFDSATGALSMKADGGNFVPGNLDLDGKAWFEPNGLLHLDGFNLGGRNGPYPEFDAEGKLLPPKPCRYIFYAG